MKLTTGCMGIGWRLVYEQASYFLRCEGMLSFLCGILLISSYGSQREKIIIRARGASTKNFLILQTINSNKCRCNTNHSTSCGKSNYSRKSTGSSLARFESMEGAISH